MKNVAQMPWSICGCGGAGGALAVAIAQAGEEVLVWDRKTGRARHLARRDRIHATSSLPRLLRESRVLLLAISDSALSEFALRLAREPVDAPRCAVALHLAGAMGSEVLEPLSREHRMDTGVFHPVVALQGPPSAGLLRGASATISGAPAAIASARRLALLLGLHPLEVEDGSRPLVHLAAVMGAGDLVALAGLASGILAHAGIAPAEGRRLLAHLARSAIARWEQEGLGRAVTGPAARGDLATLDAHLAAARGLRRERELGLLHRLLALEGARAAKEAGRLDHDRWLQLQLALGQPPFAGEEEPP